MATHAKQASQEDQPAPPASGPRKSLTQLVLSSVLLILWMTFLAWIAWKE